VARSSVSVGSVVVTSSFPTSEARISSGRATAVSGMVSGRGAGGAWVGVLREQEAESRNERKHRPATSDGSQLVTAAHPQRHEPFDV